MSASKIIQHSEQEITIPEGLPDLDGSFTRLQRVEIALDVIATLKSNQRKFVLASTYFDTEQRLPDFGQLNSSRIKGRCYVCARGMLFIKSLDRFNSFDLEMDHINPAGRTEDEWGESQTKLIEGCFEGYAEEDDTIKFFYAHGGYNNRKAVLIAICENIVINNGELVLSSRPVSDNGAVCPSDRVDRICSAEEYGKAVESLQELYAAQMERDTSGE